MLNFIPGYSTAKNVLSGTMGLMFGAGLMSIINYSQRRKEKEKVQFLEEEIQALKLHISQIDFKAQEKAIMKVGLLKQMAWKDAQLHDKEYKFIVQYIVKNKYLEPNIKIMLIDNLQESPPLLDSVFETLFSFLKKESKLFFENEEEKMGFISILEQLKEVDDSIHKSEIQFIKRLKSIKVP